MSSPYETTDRHLHLSPTDLSRYVGCQHAARLELDRRLDRPTPARHRSPDADLLAELGSQHERAYLEHLRQQGLEVHHPGSQPTGDTTRVVDLMRDGVDVIAQAPLASGRWSGVADVLVRVPGESTFGRFAYEVQDTKLSTTTRTATILQLVSYAFWLQELQGTPGEYVHVVAPDGTGGFAVESHRVDDYAAATRLAHRRFEHFVEEALADTCDTQPEPVPNCDVCPWWQACATNWRETDHLSLVANLGAAQRAELERQGVATRRGLAELHENVTFTPGYGRRETYLAAAHQAHVQVASELEGSVRIDPLPEEPGRGLARLPNRSDHDLYLDLEGTPFFRNGGLEYLWGWAGTDNAVRHTWAISHHEEKQAVEAFLDVVREHLAHHPDAHVYHYGPYEVSALKRLVSRHGTRVDELDGLLRREAFVDLLPVARQAFRIGVEAYSLKDLERVHGYERQADLRDVGAPKRAVEHALVLGASEAIHENHREVVARYNADDVRSTIALHEYLDEARLHRGIPARPAVDAEISDDLAEARRDALALIGSLRQDLPEDPAERTDDQQASWLLSNLIDFERRESNVTYWEKFALQDMTDDELTESPKGLAGLEHIAHVGGTAKVPIHRYRFPKQDVDRRSHDELHFEVPGDQGPHFQGFAINRLDPSECTIDIKQGRGYGDARPASGFLWNIVPAKKVAEARADFAAAVVARGWHTDGKYRVGRDLVLGLVGGSRGDAAPARGAEESTMAAARRLAGSLRRGVLPIQGPPGAGKTYTASHMIVDLARAGRRIGVTALSNQVISNLLGEVAAVAKCKGLELNIVQKSDPKAGLPAGVQPIKDYKKVQASLEDGSIHVLGGTAWLWSRPEFRECVDTLFIDEAGQLSLAAAVSVSTAAKNVVLLGDPQQLTQPIQGAHPDGADVSALEHLLEGKRTLDPGRGLFLDRTYRMAPPVTRFISEQFYDGRLESIDATRRVRLTGTDRFDGAGLSFLPVAHNGRDGWSPEEVTVVKELIGTLLTDEANFTDRDGTTCTLTPDDILLVAPFNRQVNALSEALAPTYGPRLRIGTVDRFQGKEAPVVIYSLGVSTQDLAPRGLDFLFSSNRMNVAISRAQARAILIASPRLFADLPGTPQGLALLNTHARFLELADDAAISEA